MTVTVSGASGFGRMLYMSTGQPSEAIAAFERALNLRRRLFDKNDLRIADSLFHLGVQQGLASAQGAEESLQECLAIRRHHFDSANTDVATTHHFFGKRRKLACMARVPQNLLRSLDQQPTCPCRKTVTPRVSANPSLLPL